MNQNWNYEKGTFHALSIELKGICPSLRSHSLRRWGGKGRGYVKGKKKPNTQEKEAYFNIS